MRTFPRHHVSRPRLTALLEGGTVGLVEAGAGFGKSVLAAEFAALLGVVTVEARLGPGPVSPGLLASRLRAGARRVGLWETDARMADAGGDAAGAIDALLESLAAEAALISVDDVHLADPRAAALLARLAECLGPRHRLLVLGRSMPPGSQRLQRMPEVVRVDPALLALNEDEVTELCRHGFGLALDPSQAATVRRATGGWAAAVVLAASRASGSSGGPGWIDALGSAGHGTVLATLVDEILDALDPLARAGLVQLAHLPIVDPALATEATGVPRLFAAAAEAGLPFTSLGDGWWDLPGPVRDLLSRSAPPDGKVMGQASLAYVERGELGLATQVLLAAGDAEATAELVSGFSAQQASTLDLQELEAIVESLPDEALAAHPGVLLHLARACESAAETGHRTAILTKAARLADALADPMMAREIDAEYARDLARDNRSEVAVALASRLLSATGPAETATRARLHDTLGRATAFDRQERALRVAERHLSEAARLYRQLGELAWFAQVMLPLAIWVHYERGEFDLAVHRLSDGLDVLPGPSRQRAVHLTFRAEVLIDCGRFEEAADDIAEAHQLADRLGDHRIHAYAEWDAARSASQRGDARATLDHVRRVESHRGDWWEHSGADFLADAADILDRVGEIALAVEYLGRARAAPPTQDDYLVDLAGAALAARHGDPEEAEAALLALTAGSRVGVREAWRITLLRAVAALRRGDPHAGGLAARAFEEAARIGSPNLPLVRERELAEGLAALAAETGQPAAVALDASRLPVGITLLGRFEVTRGGRVVALPAGQGRRLLKFLAVCGGRAHADEAMEALWPEIDPESGRNRLRTVLGRLRASGGDLVVRDDESLVLGDFVDTDIARFQADSRKALAIGVTDSRAAVALARAGIVRYRGDLLPDDPYEPWAAGPRERLRRQALALLDLCAGDAATRHNLDEACFFLEKAIELAPYEEDRHLTMAGHLIAQGRRGSALAVLGRARAALSEMGLPPTAALVDLEDAARR
jgi:ATP/maltotriose-dependent transcriptional regulator MalT/DNA-binding SARP family transcriptional activator